MTGRSLTLPPRMAERVAFGIVVLSNVLFAVGLALLPVLPELDEAVNSVLSLATSWSPALVFWLVAGRSRFGRAGILLAATAVTANAIGDTLYIALAGPNGYLPSPSAADVPYLLFYALMLVALLVTLARRSRELVLAAVVDVGVAALTAAAVFVALLAPLIEDATTTNDVAAAVVNVAYPVLDVILLAVLVAVLAMLGDGSAPRWWALISGLVVFVVADVAYALLERDGSYVEGTPLDLTWGIGLALLAWWALGPTRLDPHGFGSGGRLATIIPGMAVLVGLGVLVLASFRSLPLASVILAALAVGLAAGPVIFRQQLLRRLVEGQEHVVTELQAIDDARTQMITTLNHELRTPLTSIRGYLEVVQDGEGGAIPEPAAAMLQIVDHNARRMGDLVDDMLLVSRMDAHSVALDLVDVPLGAVVERVRVSLERTASSRDVRIEAVVPESLPHVRLDPARFERVLVNLVDNAVKFSDRGGVVLVEARATGSATGDEVLITVADSGIGIPASELPEIFNRFARASNAEGAAIRGSGLGLAIAKGLVEEHGGRIRIASELGIGTTVTITLPASPVE